MVMDKVLEWIDCSCPPGSFLFNLVSRATNFVSSDAKKANSASQGKDSNSKEPLLNKIGRGVSHSLTGSQISQTDEQRKKHKEPLLLAKVAQEDEAGNWDRLQTLATPSNWRKIFTTDYTFSDSENERAGTEHTEGTGNEQLLSENGSLLVDIMEYKNNNVQHGSSKKSRRKRRKASIEGDEIYNECSADDADDESQDPTDNETAGGDDQDVHEVDVVQLEDVERFGNHFKGMKFNSTHPKNLKVCRSSPTHKLRKVVRRKSVKSERSTRTNTVSQEEVERETAIVDRCEEKKPSLSSLSAKSKSSVQHNPQSPNQAAQQQSNGELESMIVGNLIRTQSVMNWRYKGKSFGSLFVIEDQIGYGSTAHVFKCRRKRQLSPTLNPTKTSGSNVFAVKVIDKKKLLQITTKGMRNGRTNLLTQLKQEIEILDKLRHPHIIKLFGMFESETTLYVVTEYCSGGELFSFLTQQRFGVLQESLAKKLVKQVTSAVSYMHENGIIHRDIKLENILLLRNEDEEDGITLKIIDFGLAKATGYMLSKHNLENQRVESVKGRAKTFFGTLGYLAPEMFLKKTYNHSVDVWALGILTYVLLCGNFPFDDSPSQISKLRNNRKINLRERYRVKYPSRVRKKLSAEAKDFLTQLLDPNPTTRIPAQKALQHPWLMDTP